MLHTCIEIVAGVLQHPAKQEPPVRLLIPLPYFASKRADAQSFACIPTVGCLCGASGYGVHFMTMRFVTTNASTATHVITAYI